MKTVASFLKNRRVIEIIGLILLSIVLWYGLSYISFGPDRTVLGGSTRALLILLVWVGWLLKISFTMWKQVRNNNGLTDELKKSAEQDSMSGGHVQQQSRDEISELKSRFSDAIGRLAKSRFGADGKKLYQLPWYIMIGPPGAGKTTAIENSGLNFPLRQTNGNGAISGAGGTRHCDWWFTDEAVLIDTAGRFTTQDSNRSVDSVAWHGFLDLLRKYRKRRPVNGIIVSVSARDLLLKSGPQQKELAETIRQRIDELQTRLSVQAPVYLAITKLDLLEGFTPFFEDMGREERDQPWGVAVGGQSERGDLARALGDLVRRVGRRAFSRLQQEQDLQKRSSIQKFPMQFEELIAATEKFFHAAFSPDPYRNAPDIRGIYFSSATQEGSPIDRMMSVVFTHFNLGRAATFNQPTTGKSFFIHDLFRNVIFPEAEVGGVNRRYERILLWSRRLGIASASALALVVIWGWSASAQHNEMLMRDVQTKAERFQTLHASYPESEPPPDALAAMLDETREASQVYDRQESPWLSNWGLFNDRVDQAADRLYQTALEQLLVTEMESRIEDTLKAKLVAGDSVAMFTDLKVYLMLGQPSRMDTNQVVNHFVGIWRREFPELADTRAQLKKHTQHLLETGQVRMSIDETLVADIRSQLMEQTASEMVYEVFLNDLMGEPDLYLAEHLNRNTLDTFGLTADDSLAIVPYRYTKEAWSDANFSAQSDLVKEYRNNLWVLGKEKQGEALESEVAKIAREVESMYLRDYETFWAQRIRQWALMPVSTLTGLNDALRALADPEKSPITKMAEFILTHTQLTRQPETELLQKEKLKEVPGSLSGKVIEPTSVDLAFKDIHEWIGGPGQPATGSQGALASLGAVSQFISEITVASNPEQAAFGALKKRFVQRDRDALRQLRLVVQDSPEPIKEWLTSVADQVWAAVVRDGHQYAQNRLNKEVCEFYNSRLAGRFPMASSTREASTEDFNAYFGPSGIEATYVASYIKPFINLSTNEFVIVEGQRFPISPATLSLVNRADYIRRALYQNGDTVTLNLEFIPVKLEQSVSSFAYTASDSQPRIEYRHGPKLPTRLAWVSGVDNRVRIQFVDINGTRRDQEFSGSWSVLRSLLENSRQATGGANAMEVVFNVQGRKANYLIQANHNIDAIRYNSFYKYSCPASL